MSVVLIKIELSNTRLSVSKLTWSMFNAKWLCSLPIFQYDIDSENIYVADWYEYQYILYSVIQKLWERLLLTVYIKGTLLEVKHDN